MRERKWRAGANRHMTNSRKQAIIAATTILLSVHSGGAVHACMTAAELKADQIRFVDLQLRLAALQCRGGRSSLTNDYNHFVLKHRDLIKVSRKPVEGYLLRRTRLSMDRYVTQQSNLISLNSLEQSGFCENAKASARIAIQLDEPRYVLDMLPVSYQSPEPLCRDGHTADWAKADNRFAADAQR